MIDSIMVTETKKYSEMIQKNKILIVDDSISVIEAIKSVLQKDYIIQTATSGEDALKVLTNFFPDLILLDVLMPGMSGYEVCQKIRSHEKYKSIKIIMVSSMTQLEERLKGYEAGADDYIGKPFRDEELLAKVRVFIRLKNTEDQLQLLNLELNNQVKIRTQQLIDAEKMAAIGRYAAGIIHNLNTPLQAIMGNAELLSLIYPDNPHIMNLRKAAAQMKRIIGTILLTGYRESTIDIVDVNLNEVITDQIELFKADMFFKHQVQTILDLHPLPLYRGVYHHFSYTLNNLIKNAVDAMYNSQKKILTISTSVKEGEICIQISDTGHGIPADKLDKIFHPFYTTKPLISNDKRPTGTGLGLAASKEMIQSYKGKITVASTPGVGSTFTVHLPLT